MAPRVALCGLSVLLACVGGCGDRAPHLGFAIALTIRADDEVTDAELAEVASFEFESRGDESLRGSVRLDRTARRVETAVYRPLEQSREVAIEVRALDADGVVLARGDTGTLALTAGATTSVEVVLWATSACADPSCDAGVPLDLMPPPDASPACTCSLDCGVCAGEDVLAVRSQQTITIDGDASDWPATLLRYELSHDRWLPQYSTSPPMTDADESARLRLQWDASNLYVLVEVSDDSVIASQTPIYRGDSVELLLDAKRDRSTSFDANDYQLTIDADGNHGGLDKGVVYSYAGKRVPGGYVIEYAVPFANIQVVPTVGVQLGFDLALNDFEAADGIRDAYLLWKGALVFSNTTQYANLLLVP